MIITKTLTLEEITCGTCGIIHAVPQDWIDRRRSERGDIHCPNGCFRSWRESDADRLRKQLQAKERELSEAKCEALRKTHLLEEERAAREKSERQLDRASKGVCPCCNRSFTNLRRHMLSKHPKKLHK